MKQIFKYALKDDKIQTVPLTKGAEILSVQIQHNEMVLWALVDASENIEYRGIRIIGTGWEINEDMRNMKYISTVQDGLFVWHIFEQL